MRRGEIWTGSGSGLASKPRPVVVIQDDRFDATESVTVCLLTTSPRDLPLLRVPVAASATNGLSEDSRVMLDRVTTLRRSNLRERIGTLEHEHLIAVERGLVVFLGIAG
ncbi:growth inhibitor PemK [Nocardioides sp. Soil797]|nr:growth inhibitor PemK [Nocardioides sp. Soil797]